MLELREYRAIHDRHIAWLNDDELMRFSEQRHLPHTRASVQEYVDQCFWFRGIYLNTQLIGTVAGHLDIFNDVIDLGILCVRKGCGKDSWKLALSALEGHRLVVAGCMTCNHAMVNILDDTMIYDHTRHKVLMYSGKEMSTVHYRNR